MYLAFLCPLEFATSETTWVLLVVGRILTRGTGVMLVRSSKTGIRLTNESIGARTCVVSRRNDLRIVTWSGGICVTLEVFSSTVEETFIEKSDPASSMVEHSIVTSSSSVDRLQILRCRDVVLLLVPDAASADDSSLKRSEFLETIKKSFSIFRDL